MDDFKKQVKEVIRINKLMCKDMDLLAREIEILKNAYKVLCKDYIKRMDIKEDGIEVVMYQ